MQCDMSDRNRNQFDLYISVWVNIKFHIIGGHFEVLHSKWKKLVEVSPSVVTQR